MSDLLGISSTAVAAYQRALGTVSNNIANVSTEGYSRQTSTLTQSTPARQANMFLGTGVLFTSVKRAFDTFAESNLRNSNTDLSTQTPMVEYTQRVMDIMGDQSVGLSSALDAFFESARSLSVDPASGVMRTSFLRSTEGVGSRFAELSGQLNLVSNETRQAVESAAGQLNTLTEQLSLVNQQLTKGTTLDSQPPELLDRRDLLLRQMSEYSRIKTSFTSNGLVSVSLGSTMKQSLVVDGIRSRPVGMDPNSNSKLDMVIDPYGKTEPLSGASGGTFGGLNTFISQVLEPAQKNLDFLAQSFVDEVNKVQKNGIDGYGNMGQPLMKIDVTAVSKAQGIGMVLSDPMRVATGALFRVTENNSNASDVKARVSYTPPPAPLGVSNSKLVNNPFTSNPVPIEVSGGRLYAEVSTLSAGMENPVIYLDNVKPGQQLQVLTKDGRQLIGSKLSVDEKYQLLTKENGFTDPVTFSDAYLNKSGPDGYLNTNVFYGAKGSVVTSNNVYAKDSQKIEVSQFANFQRNAFGRNNQGAGFANTTDAITGLTSLSLSFMKDGVVGTAVTIAARTPVAIVNEINANTAITGVKAELLSTDTGTKIVLSGNSGKSNTFNLAANAGLSLPDPVSFASQYAEDHQISADAAFKLDGVQYFRNTNLVTDVTPGVALNLKSFHILDVKQLAKPLQIMSSGFADTTTALSKVDFNLSLSINGGSAVYMPIQAGQSSPAGIVKAINGSAQGITAELVDTKDGSANPFKILLTSRETGTTKGFRLSVANSLVTKLNLTKDSTGKLQSASFIGGAATNLANAAGKLSFALPSGASRTIAIGQNATPTDIIAAVNAASGGVITANWVDNVGTAGGRITFSTTEAGGFLTPADVSGTDENGSPDLKLNFALPFQAAKDSIFTVNGKSYTRSSNFVSDILTGTTLNLQKPGTISTSEYFNGITFKKGAPVLQPAKLETAHIQQLTAGPDGLTVIAKGAIQLNGKPLGSLELASNALLTPQRVAAWLQKGLDDNQISDMNVEVFNQIRFNAAALDFRKPLSINGIKIGTVSQDAKVVNEYKDLSSMVKAIQAAQDTTGVIARIADNGDLILENALGREGESITLGPKDVNGQSFNAFNLNLSGVNGMIQGQVRLTRAIGDPAKSDIRLSFGTPPTAGSPFDLSMVGLRTAAYIEGKVPDDLQVFVTGEGKASIAASYAGQPTDPQQKLRSQKLVVTFDTANHYIIKDSVTGTILAERNYDNSVLNPVVNYQGLAIKLSRAPDVGDVFAVDGNQDGLGNNENMLVMVDLAKKGVIGNKSFSDSYIDQVNTVGNAAQQAKITQQALTVVNDQAMQSRDKVSGVNLDDEAADLIRFQQAYQAAAKSLQISGQLFDSIVQIR